MEAEVATALDLVHRLTEMVADVGRLDLAAEAFRLTNARLFLGFRPTRVKKRMLNKVTGGIVIFGTARTRSKPTAAQRGGGH